MNPLILSLAPLCGLATALPAMTAAATQAVKQPGARAKTDARQRQSVEGQRRAFDPRKRGGRETPTHERNGGYLLL